MAEIPGDIANAASSGRVPKGIDLSYLAQERNEPTIIATLFVFSLTTFVIILRCYARRCILKKFGLDDAIAVATMVSFTSIVRARTSRSEMPFHGRNCPDMRDFPGQNCMIHGD